MKPTNTLVQKEKQTFSTAITGEKLQNLMKKSVASPDAAARFTGTLISAVAASSQLQRCKPATVVAAALRGEGMGLTLGREYHLIPFGDNCAFVIGYKGLIALCLAGNDVADMDCVEVREGEYTGRDRRTKRPVFDFSVYATDEEAAAHPVVGYMSYCEMKDGYFRAEYMTVDEILRHAQRYSKAFDINKYHKLQNGELSPQEAERLMQGSPYYSAPDTMFKKTVLRKLLNSGYIRLANSATVRETMNYDNGIEDNIIPDLDVADMTVETTGEVIDMEPASDTAEIAQEVAAVEAIEDTPDKPKRAPAKRGRPRKAVAQKHEHEEAVGVVAVDDDYEANFFGE